MDIKDVAKKDYTINYVKINEMVAKALKQSGTQVPARRYPIIYS